MKTLTIPMLLAASLALTACGETAPPAGNAATTAAAAPVADPDDDAAEPTENEAAHGHPHDGEDADHAH